MFPCCHLLIPKPSPWQAALHPDNGSQGNRGGRELGGVETSAAPGKVGLTRRGLFLSPGVKHVDLLLIDGRMILIKIQAGVRAPLKAAHSQWGKECIRFCFVAIAGRVLLLFLSLSENRCNLRKRAWISLYLEESGHRSTGLQVEAQPCPLIIQTPQGLSRFCLWRNLSRRLFNFSDTCQLCLWLSRQVLGVKNFLKGKSDDQGRPHRGELRCKCHKPQSQRFRDWILKWREHETRARAEQEQDC